MTFVAKSLDAASVQARERAPLCNNDAQPPSVMSVAAATGEPAIEIAGLSRHFPGAAGGEVRAVDEVDLLVRRGDFVVLLGPSGCGKTTLLRCIAGLESPQSGSVRLGGRQVYSADERINVPPNRRGISMVFQSYALWPHMTAFENLAFPLKVRKVERSSIRERVNEALKLVGIEGLAQRYPAQMSGGQQQRVALARAIVAKDDVILFDEPLSNVDAKVRESLRLDLLELHDLLGFAAVYVTHDQQEAMEMATKVAVMRSGRIEQLGDPNTIYNRPSSLYVAEFVGTTNKLVGTVVEVTNEALRAETPVGTVTSAQVGSASVGDTVALVWRPEATLLNCPEGSDNTWPGQVARLVFSGAHTDVVVDIGNDETVRCRCNRDLPDVGDRVTLSVNERSVMVLADTVVGGAQ